jgi:succinoglycan biosynthesis protein ExoO
MSEQSILRQWLCLMIPSDSPKPLKPIVSVIMANYNGARYLLDAIMSVRKQTLRDLELIISDDGSTDKSVHIVEEAARADPRIRLIRSDHNHGPGAARNKALAIATGDWIAVVDSDDLIHPERLARLIEMALKDGASIIADDLLFFDSNFSDRPRALLSGKWARAPFWVKVNEYIQLNRLYGAGPVIGYLKPVFRASLVANYRLHYDESLSVGEDYHFILAMLRRGEKFRVYPELSYFYRRRKDSTSHRWSVKALVALKRADQALLCGEGLTDVVNSAAMKARLGSIETAIQYERLLASIRSREWLRAAAISLGCPSACSLLRLPLGVRVRRLFDRNTPSTGSDRLQICILSRQRVVGRTNGSSSYLLDLVQSIGQNAIDLHFLAPSPSTLGRWPYLKMRDELSIFRSYRIRGAWRCGPYIITCDPRRAFRGACAVIDRALMKMGITKGMIFKSDPYSIAEPLSRQDQLFLARHAPKSADFLIADYCFLTECLPFALRPDARSAVIMHDRFSSRAEQFRMLGTTDSVASISEQEECRRLALADCVVAIQFEEGEWARRRIPGREVIVAPMAARPISSPETGEDDLVLFVGSSAKPNIDGVNWFLAECWPLIKKRRPEAIFEIAGSLCDLLGPVPLGVKLLGFVDDLAPVYRRAGVVVSPLRAGSGLKIKLIEALSRGKAVVGTPNTCQGIEHLVAGSLMLAESAEDIVAAISDLLNNKEGRAALAARGLRTVRQHFSQAACYRGLLDIIAHPTSNRPLSSAMEGGSGDCNRS